MVAPQILLAADGGLEETAKTGFGAKKPLSDTSKIPFYNDSIPGIIGQIIGAILSFVGVIFFLLLIYGGILWMTARGNEENVKKSISLMTQAAYGLIIIAAAYLITKYIGSLLLRQ